LNDMAKNLLLWMIIAAVLLTVFNNFSQPTSSEQLIYSDFIEEVQSGQVAEVNISNLNIIGVRNNGTRFTTVLP
jgi:cell division protease FtsH